MSNGYGFMISCHPTHWFKIDEDAWTSIETAPTNGEIVVVKGSYDANGREVMHAVAAKFERGAWWRDKKAFLKNDSTNENKTTNTQELLITIADFEKRQCASLSMMAGMIANIDKQLTNINQVAGLVAIYLIIRLGWYVWMAFTYITT